MKSLFLLLISLVSLAENSYAQVEETRMLIGLIVDGRDPIIGANIYLRDNPNIGVSSDIDGKFRLQVPKSKNFKLHISMCLCSKNPNDIIIKKTDAEIKLKLKGCNFKKITTKKTSKSNKD